MFDFNRLRDPDNQSSQLNLKDNFLESKIKQTNYEIVNEIPRFTDNSYATNFGDQWKEYDKDQFDDQEGDYEHLKRSFDTLQLCFPHTLSNLKNKLVLEAGSGYGRFTHVLLNHKAIVDTFDLSYSVDALKENLINHKNYNLYLKSITQASILKMPYQKKFYDYVICVHVLQHTPDPEESIKKLWEMLKPGGYLVIDHYRLKLKSMYPPIGGFGNLFRKITLCLPYRYQKNFSELPHGDINDVKIETIPKFDILTAGFPCQPFSKIGMRQGFKHKTQGNLFFNIAEILREKEPISFILENVSGLLTHKSKDKKTLDIMFSELEKIGYEINYKLIDSSNFGVPQIRRRIFNYR